MTPEQARELAREAIWPPSGVRGDGPPLWGRVADAILKAVAEAQAPSRGDVTDEDRRRLAEIAERLKKTPFMATWRHAIHECRQDVVWLLALVADLEKMLADSREEKGVAAAVRAEREACARLVDEYGTDFPIAARAVEPVTNAKWLRRYGNLYLAEAIRARGKGEGS